MGVLRKEGASFLKKKKQKTLGMLPRAHRQRKPRKRVFGSPFKGEPIPSFSYDA
jgi:hypothetical protein